MSFLTEKLHGFITKIRGGIEIAHHDVDEVVTEVVAHLNETLVPIVRSAVADALQFERDEAQRIVEKLGEIYQKLVDEHGVEEANQAVAEAHEAVRNETPSA